MLLNKVKISSITRQIRFCESLSLIPVVPVILELLLLIPVVPVFPRTFSVVFCASENHPYCSLSCLCFWEPLLLFPLMQVPCWRLAAPRLATPVVRTSSLRTSPASVVVPASTRTKRCHSPAVFSKLRPTRQHEPSNERQRDFLLYRNESDVVTGFTFHSTAKSRRTTICVLLWFLHFFLVLVSSCRPNQQPSTLPRLTDSCSKDEDRPGNRKGMYTWQGYNIDFSGLNTTSIGPPEEVTAAVIASCRSSGRLMDSSSSPLIIIVILVIRQCVVDGAWNPRSSGTVIIIIVHLVVVYILFWYYWSSVHFIHPQKFI